MNKDDFADYLRCMNTKDFDGLAKYYTPDLRLLSGFGPVPMSFEGREAMLEMERDQARLFDWEWTINQLVLDKDGAAADASMARRALKDLPDTMFGPMKAGEEVKMRCFIFYKLRDGKISEIRLSQFTGQ